MIWELLLLLLVGIFLSAFFSGSETGFYRVSRVRLMLDALGGDLTARMLLWLTNHPTLFVATTLIGNNAANYLTSLAIVLAAHSFASPTIELIAPVALAPLIFVYGELLPKNLFYHAPNFLLRRGGPLLLLFAALFAPVSAILWLLGYVLERCVGQTPLRIQLTLARKELEQVFREGQYAGILHSAQQTLAQNLFSVAARPVSSFSVPVTRVASVRMNAGKADVLRMARRHNVSVVPVRETRGRGLVGYVRIVDLYLDATDSINSVRPLMEFGQHDSHVAALINMQSEKEDLACVVDPKGTTVGLVYAADLMRPLFHGD